MKQAIKKLDELVVKHNKHISLVALSVLSITVLGIGFPMMLLAQEGLPTTSSHYFVPRSDDGNVSSSLRRPIDHPLPPVYRDGGFPTGTAVSGTLRAWHPGEKGDRPQPFKMNDEQFKKLQPALGPVEAMLKQFEEKIAKLQGQGIGVASSTRNAIQVLHDLVGRIRGAENQNAVSSTAMGDFVSLLKNVKNSDNALEQAARWKNSLKQADQTLKQLNRLVAQDKALADKLTAQGYDVSAQLNTLTSAVAALQVARDSAAAQIKTDSAAAFTTLQNDFFEKVDSVKQADQTLKQLASLSRFTQNAKAGTTAMQKAVAELKAKNVDTASLEAISAQISAKASDISALLQVKPLDQEALSTAFTELQKLRMQFEEAKHVLVGDGNEKMPWSQGANNFDTKPLNSAESIINTTTAGAAQ